MNLIDPIFVTAVGVSTGALVRRWTPRLAPRDPVQACAIGGAGAWAAVLLGGYLSVRNSPLGLSGVTACACALLGSALALDLYHLLLRRRACWPVRWVAHAPVVMRGVTSLNAGPAAQRRLPDRASSFALGRNLAPNLAHNLARKRRVHRRPGGSRSRTFSRPAALSRRPD